MRSFLTAVPCPLILRQMRLESGPERGPDDDAIEVHRAADRGDPARAGGWVEGGRRLRRHGVSSSTFYAWKAKYGGMDVCETKRLGVLEDENAKLKRLLADAMLDNTVLNRAGSAGGCFSLATQPCLASP
jgi:hypothetical protein